MFKWFKKNPKNYYKADIICENCHYEGSADIEKRTRINFGRCPNCECMELKDKYKEK